MDLKLNLRDSLGQSLKIGDSVIAAWRWGPYKGKLTTEYLLHTIECKETTDRPGIQLYLSGCTNLWKGRQVTGVNPDLFSHIPKGQHFIFIDGKAVSTEKLNLTGLSAEEYEKMNKEFEKLEARMFWRDKK